MNVFELAAKLTLNTDEYEEGLDNAKEKGGGIGSALKKGLSVAGAAITAATGAAVAFAASAVQVGSEFDSSMSQVAATLGLTMDEIRNNTNGAGDTFQALRDKAQEMGAATNFSASQAAEGLNILAMSGFSAEQSISMVEDVLHLAAAGSMDMASAAGYISGAMKGFNDETKDSAYYADLMAKGATLANTSVQQLGEAMSGGAASAAAYGQSADSMTIALLRLAEQGDVGSAAGTALAAAMKDLYTPTDQAAAALAELGVNAYEDGKALDFNDVVNSLSDALSGMSDEQANAYKQTIFGIQGLNAFNKMTVTGIDKQEQWAEALADASDGMGEAAKQYATMTDNLQGDVDQWNSALDGFKIVLSDELMPTVRQFVQFGTSAMGTITEAWKNNGLEGAMQALGGVISDGLSMILEMLPSFIDAGVQLLISLGTGIIENLPLLVDAALQIIVSLANGLADSLPTLIPTIVSVVLQIVDTLTDPDTLSSLIDAAIAIMLALTYGIIDALPQLLERLPEIIIRLVETLVDNAPKLLEAAVEIIAQLIIGIAENLPKLLEAGIQIVGSILEGIVKVIGDIIKAGKELVDKVKEGFQAKIGDAKQWGKDLINNFISGIKQMWENLKNTVKNVAQTVKDFLGFSEPEEGPLSNFHTFAPDMMMLFAEGVRKNKRLVTDAVTDAFSFQPTLAVAGTCSNRYVSTADNSLQAELRETLRAMRNMRVVMDTGETVGALASPMDGALGTQYIYRKRGII